MADQSEAHFSKLLLQCSVAFSVEYTDGRYRRFLLFQKLPRPFLTTFIGPREVSVTDLTSESFTYRNLRAVADTETRQTLREDGKNVSGRVEEW